MLKKIAGSKMVNLGPVKDQNEVLLGHYLVRNKLVFGDFYILRYRVIVSSIW